MNLLDPTRPVGHNKPMNETKRQQQTRQALEHTAIEEATKLFSSLTDQFLAYPQMMELAVQAVGGTLALEASPHPADVGRLVGGRGAMSHSMRSVLAQVARRYGHELHYVVRDEGGFVKEREPEFAPDPEWPRGLIVALFADTCGTLFSKPVQSEVKCTSEKTNCYVLLDPKEPVLCTDAELRDGLSRIFNAIGKANGRLIFVDGLKRGRA